MSDFTDSSDAVQARSDREIPHTELANKIPQAILDLPRPVPSRQPLQGDEASAAVSALLDKNYSKLQFPRTFKSRDDPVIHRQNWGLLSFVPSAKATPDKEGCFGVMKFRGAFSTQDEAENYAQYLITEIDSYSEISVCRIGSEFPLMLDDSAYTEATREVDIRKKMDDTYKANFKKKREEEKKQMKEIQERRQQLMDPTHSKAQERAVDDLDLYIELRIKKANAMMAQDECKKTMDSAADIVRKTDSLLEKIETDHPDYEDEYLERYQRALTAIGTSPAQSTLIEYMVKSDKEKKKASQPSISVIEETFEEQKQ